MSDVSAYGTYRGVFIREFFWLIVITEGNEDEAEIYEQARPGDMIGYTGRVSDEQAAVVTYPAALRNFTWEMHRGGLFELPVAG